ncbi:MAG: hypothetical protein R3291_01920 [Thermoplasmata archaeon]|nr:hypothetical protein [Thermoplasmata archaeon]
MEQPLRTLFLHDVRVGADVKFRPLVFYAVFATGFVFLFVLESLLLPLVADPLPVPVLPNPFFEWMALGLIAALASFRWVRAGPRS